MNIPGRLTTVLSIAGTYNTVMALAGTMPTPLLRQGFGTFDASGIVQSASRMLYAGKMASLGAGESEFNGFVQLNAKNALLAQGIMSGGAIIGKFVDVSELSRGGIAGKSTVIRFSGIANIGRGGVASDGLLKLLVKSANLSQSDIDAQPLLKLNARTLQTSSGAIAAAGTIAILAATTNASGSVLGASSKLQLNAKSVDASRGTLAAAGKADLKGRNANISQSSIAAEAIILVIVLAQGSLLSRGDIIGSAQVVNLNPNDYRINVGWDWDAEQPIDGLEFDINETVSGVEMLQSFTTFAVVQGIEIYGAGPED